MNEGLCWATPLLHCTHLCVTFFPLGKVAGLSSMESATIQNLLRSKNIFHIASRQENGQTRMYLSARVMAPSKEVLIEVTLPPAASGINGAKVCVKTEHVPVKSLVAVLVKNTLQGN